MALLLLGWECLVVVVNNVKTSISVFIFLRASFEFDQSVMCIPGPGWRAEIRPADHPISDYEFDVIIGADGRRSTLDGKE